MWFISVFLLLIDSGEGMIGGEPLIGTPYVVPFKMSAVVGNGLVYTDEHYRNCVFIDKRTALMSLLVGEHYAEYILMITFYFNLIDDKVQPYTMNLPDIKTNEYGISRIRLGNDAPKIDALEIIKPCTRQDYDHVELHSYHMNENGSVNFRFGQCSTLPIDDLHVIVNGAKETGNIFGLGENFRIGEEDIGAALIGVDEHYIELIGLLLWPTGLDRYSDRTTSHFWIQYIHSKYIRNGITGSVPFWTLLAILFFGCLSLYITYGKH